MSMKTGAYGSSYFLSQVFFVIFTTIVFEIAFLVTDTITPGNGILMFFVLMI
jgi:hypothetical protein